MVIIGLHLAAMQRKNYLSLPADVDRKFGSQIEKKNVNVVVTRKSSEVTHEY